MHSIRRTRRGVLQARVVRSRGFPPDSLLARWNLVSSLLCRTTARIRRVFPSPPSRWARTRKSACFLTLHSCRDSKSTGRVAFPLIPVKSSPFSDFNSVRRAHQTVHRPPRSRESFGEEHHGVDRLHAPADLPVILLYPSHMQTRHAFACESSRGESRHSGREGTRRFCGPVHLSCGNVYGLPECVAGCARSLLLGGRVVRR